MGWALGIESSRAMIGFETDSTSEPWLKACRCNLYSRSSCPCGSTSSAPATSSVCEETVSGIVFPINFHARFAASFANSTTRHERVRNELVKDETILSDSELLWFQHVCSLLRNVPSAQLSTSDPMPKYRDGSVAHGSQPGWIKAWSISVRSSRP